MVAGLEASKIPVGWVESNNSVEGSLNRGPRPGHHVPSLHYSVVGATQRLAQYVCCMTRVSLYNTAAGEDRQMLLTSSSEASA